MQLFKVGKKLVAIQAKKFVSLQKKRIAGLSDDSEILIPVFLHHLFSDQDSSKARSYYMPDKSVN